MATTRLPTEFREFLALLNSNNVKYLLVGGYCVGHYGYPRATADIDFWIGISRENAARVSNALVDFGFDPSHVPLKSFLRKDKIFRIGNPPLRIEILTGISGVNFEKCYPRRTVARIDGIKVDIIALKDLKKNKRASGRHKDLDDLENLPRK
jgi:predicted nucleotidyltransferase